MVSPEAVNLTQLLRESRGGDRAAFDRVLSIVYDELRRQARQYLKMQSPGHTLQPTALVHEAYLRLISGSQPDWQDRGHFFSVAAKMMRHILVDHARAQSAQKRGGDLARTEFNDALAYSGEKAADLLAIDDALTQLANLDERKARVLELRYFGGLSMEEITRVLGISAATVRRDLRYAETWMRRELQRH